MERWSEGGGSYMQMVRERREEEEAEAEAERIQERVMFLTGLLHSSAPDHQSLLLVLLDLDEVGLPDLPLPFQSAHLSSSDEGAFDTVGEADHQSLLLPSPDLPPLPSLSDLPDLPLLFQSAHLSFSDEGAFETVGEADHQSLLLDLLDFVEEVLPDLPFQSDHSSVGALDTVGAPDHHPPFLLPLPDLVEVVLLLLLPFQSDQSPVGAFDIALVIFIVICTAPLLSFWDLWRTALCCQRHQRQWHQTEFKLLSCFSSPRDTCPPATSISTRVQRRSTVR